MATAQGASLDRKKLMADPIMVSTIVVLVVFLTLFIIYPLVILLVDSFISDNGFTFDIIKGVLAKPAFRTAISNTLIIGAVTGVLSTLIGLLFAYVEVYVKLRTKFLAGLFKVVSILPVVSPPFVLSLSMILLFGRSGIISKTLLGIQDSNIYGMRSIIIIQTMTFFPVCYMMLKGLLKNIDPSLEEAARDMGASRWKVFTSVTWPLMLPGIGNAFLVTVMESIADFANPMMIGGNVDTLATSIYLQITGNYDKQGAAAMAVVLLSITFIMFFVQKYILEAKATATLSGKASRQRMLITDRRNYTLTTKWYEKVFNLYRGAQAFTDSFIMALIAAPLTALLSMIISYLVVKKKFALKGYIELSSMLAMAVPGTVLGVGFIRGYANGLFHTGALQFIYGTTAILIIVFIVRSLPTGTRSGISALRQIDKSIEESAYDMGANSFEVFMTVTLPLIKDSFLSGLVTAFVRSITAISAVILVVTPATLLITVQINEYANRGEYAVACAFSTILILITYAAVLGMNIFIKYFGTSKAQEED